MTAQISETLHYKGDSLSMRATPLSDYFELIGMSFNFQDRSTACLRRYVGNWEISLDRLYLIGISATYEDGSEATLGDFFPRLDSRVFAHWFSGVLSVPQGDVLKYVHMGYATMFKKDLLISNEQGLVVDTQVRVNSAPSSAQGSRA